MTVENIRDSEPLSEIIEAVPKWYVRFGLTVVFLIVVVAVLLMSFYKLPKKISFPVAVNPKVAEFVFTLDVGSYIDSFYVNPGSTVRPNQPLISTITTEGISKIIMSPINGTFSVLKLSESTVVSVIPKDSTLVISGLFGHGDTTQFFPGQEVRIYLDEFPEKSFGYLKCTSTEIPQMQVNNKFQFSLNCSFVTTKRIKLPIDSTMKGHAVVFSSHKTIFESLFGNLFNK